MKPLTVAYFALSLAFGITLIALGHSMQSWEWWLLFLMAHSMYVIGART